MNKFFFTIFSFIFFVNANAQDSLALVKNANEVYRFTMEKKFDSLIETTYPKLFDIVPKSQLIELTKSAFEENDMLQIEILDQLPEFKFGSIVKLNEQFVCRVEHSLKLRLIFKEKIEESNVALYIDEFKKSMETDNVFFDEKTNAFSISKRSKMVALNDKYTKGVWKFINYTKDEMLWKVIDPEIQSIMEGEE